MKLLNDALNFENKVVMIVSIAILILTFLIIGIYFFVDSFNEKKYKKKINDYHNSTFSFVIDQKNQIVKAFNIRKLKHLTSLSLEDFIATFEPESQTNVRNFLFDLIEVSGTNYDPENNNNVLSCDTLVKTKNKEKLIRTILFCRNVDVNKKLIYLDGEYLFNTPTDNINKKGKRLSKSNFYQIDDIKRKYDENHFSKGTFYIIEISKKINTNYEFYNSDFIKYTIIDYINKLPNNSSLHFFFTDNNKEIGLIDTHELNEYQLPKRIQKIQNFINEILEIKGYSNYFEYYIYVSTINNLGHIFQKAYETFQKLEKLDKDEKRYYTIYKSEQKNVLNFDEGYKNEVNRIIRSQGLSIRFRPIVHIANKRVINIGYMSFMTPVNSIFTTYNDLKKYASINNLDKELFSLTIRKTIPTFASEKDNASQKLFLPVKLDQIQFILKNLAHFSGVNEVPIVLCFESTEFIDVEDNFEIMRNIKTLSEKRYELGLFTNSDDYILKSKTYGLFDYFLFNSELEPNIKVNTTTFLKAHRFLDKLVKYNATIISYNAQNMQAIEILVKSGVEYFSSEAISPKSQMLLPLDKKICKKLLNMYK